MNNSDMPAMPLSGDAYQDFAGYDETRNTSYNPECQGLTKREHFAGLAMQGLIASLALFTTASTTEYWKKNTIEAAVEFADALLKELDK